MKTKIFALCSLLALPVVITQCAGRTDSSSGSKKVFDAYYAAMAREKGISVEELRKKQQEGMGEVQRLANIKSDQETAIRDKQKAIDDAAWYADAPRREAESAKRNADGFTAFVAHVETQKAKMEAERLYEANQQKARIAEAKQSQQVPQSAASRPRTYAEQMEVYRRFGVGSMLDGTRSNQREVDPEIRASSEVMRLWWLWSGSDTPNTTKPNESQTKKT